MDLELWTEPGAGFTPEQVERGLVLVSRDDQCTAEKQRNRLELGDLLLEIAPVGSKRSAILKTVAEFSARIGLPSNIAREYRNVAAYCDNAIRERIAAAGVAVAYSVLREAALGFSLPREERERERAMREEEQAQCRTSRWDTLFSMIQDGRTRLTAQDYREAIGARAIPNSAAAMTPDNYLEQIDKRPDVREAVLRKIATDPEASRTIATTYINVCPEAVRAELLSADPAKGNVPLTGDGLDEDDEPDEPGLLVPLPAARSSEAAGPASPPSGSAQEIADATHAETVARKAFSDRLRQIRSEIDELTVTLQIGQLRFSPGTVMWLETTCREAAAALEWLPTLAKADQGLTDENLARIANGGMS